MSASPDTEATSGIPRRESDQFASDVRGMFDRIAGVYDVMNSAMTAGLHHQWRQRAVDRAEVGPGSDALDVCCGTGDLALELRRRVGPDGRVVGCDFSEPMLELARQKSGEGGLPVEFGWADALALPRRRDHRHPLRDEVEMTRSSVPPPVTKVMDAASAWLPARMAEVEDRLVEVAAGYGPRLGEEAEATLKAGGKRLRPLLVLM